jgi:uncharacterized delta-60 repeat protein
MYVLMLGFGLLFLGQSVSGNPGDLDLTFGTSGKVVSSPDGSNRSWGAGTALQADGKIVMVGVSSLGSPNFIVARFNANGSPDLGFGTNGLALVPVSSIWVNSAGIAVQPDGKIVVAGQIYVAAGPPASYDFGVARINADGSPDMTFDGDGQAVINFNTVPGMSSGRENFSSLKIAPDGKIVTSGTLQLGTDHRFIFAKLNSDGSPDATFGNSGRYVDPSNNGSNTASISDFVPVADGGIVGAGYLLSPSGNFRIVIKVNAAGSGREWTRLQGESVFSTELKHSYFGITPIADGKFIVAGKADRKVVVQRLKSDGTLDFPFVNSAGLPEGQAYSVAVQADGKIVANLSTATVPTFSLIRFNSDGTLDNEFGTGGIAHTVVLNNGDGGGKVIVLPNQRILVGGYAQIGGSPTQYFFALARYRGGDLAPDNTDFDYDGDGRADVSVFRPSNGGWYIDRSTAGFTAITFGAATDRVVPADYDGDGKADIAIYRDGQWWILQSSDSLVKVFNFGIAEDKPQPGDYDGDGIDDIAVFRPSSSVWYVLRSADGGYHAVGFGAAGDIPQRGDYDDDGDTDFAVFRPSNGGWYIQRSTGGYTIAQFGQDGDKPVAADYDGDGKPDIAVWRPSSGVWYIVQSGNGQVTSTLFGIPTDVPVAADFDGDGKADIGVFRPSTGVWYWIQSSSSQWAQQVFGESTDRPTPAAFGP